MQNDLSKRLFTFSVSVIKFVRTLPFQVEYKVINYQLIKSATSAGANYEEAQAGISKADFTNKVRIALKEMKETNYWLRIIKEIIDPSSVDIENLTSLIDESLALNKILGSIVTRSKNT
ncbi:four helix bundle protein [Namhaeicola litoreus]|uniref:Four helix bundle protein n=1 Tax=Namhaeicola litoreus TaxID=1052145 RepID=A0ABW3Y2P2_9FLAO